MDDRESTLLDAQAVAERTALAWQRTIIGALAVGALVTRWSVTERFPLGPGIGVTVLVALASLFLVGRRYERVRDTVVNGQTPLSRYLVPGATVFMVVVILGVAAGVMFEYARS
ncbi:DUF202 domain-containing protein [Mycobacterium sp. CVI_P3]|uniref:DUF202 domain-containing protein n=1 Tax=Mycobacterium pinniadriaticum TaxID=2994102 RepID=A0ABT3SB59_9MYCO|nr:DUF202 domain-containing protein [Mycobacterium pinniadriaticum]MCX2930187.1 DUF202 domain-containing protein [Mycobacterium pinniadriaticum]MCX2936751.1 DUF202 domain-containing protein [Mycobacterium pinniadriaticum]